MQKKHLLANTFASALFMMARGGPNDGEDYYEPMLRLGLHEDPSKITEVPAVMAAISRWGAKLQDADVAVHV